VFGKKPAKKLLDNNNLMTIVRAHQVQIDGYKMHRWDGSSSFPYVITIFSAPNYCDYYSNKASVLILENGNVSIKQFDQSDHPYFLPDQVDIFTWSMPFLAEKVISMLAYIVNKMGDDGDEPDSNAAIEELSKEVKKERVSKLKSKVKVFGRMQKMFKTLKDESELILKLKGMAPDGKIPRGLLLEGRPAIKDALQEFKRAKEIDKMNERRPKD
jgi:serine/threonine-protein phosphatase 2B catalytic subunit